MSSAEPPLQPGPGIYGLDVLKDNAQVSPKIALTSRRVHAPASSVHLQEYGNMG